MSRYGRNQKRQARARIAELEATLAQTEENLMHMKRRASMAEVRATQAETRAYNAESRAFERFAASSGMLKQLAERMGMELGRALGEELMPHAERFLSAGPRRPPSLSCHRSISDTKIIRVRADIPAFAVEYAVAEEELDLNAMGGGLRHG